MSSKSVKQECFARVSSKSVLPECCAIVSSKGVLQKCYLSVSTQGVSEVGSLENVRNKYCLCSSTYVSVFGFVGFILFFFPECVARVPVSHGGLGVRLCSPNFGFVFATIGNRR